MLKCLPAKTFEKSYGNGSDIEAFTGKSDIKKLDGNILMTKDKAQHWLYKYNFHNNPPRWTVSRRIFDFKKSNNSKKTDIY